VQSDGKIVIGGDFTSVNGEARNAIARLLGNGALESTAAFNAGTGVGGDFGPGQVLSLAVQGDGKILLGGKFVSVDGQSRGNIARLNSNGSLESTAAFTSSTGTDIYVNALALQADGKILVGGDFTQFSGVPRTALARLTNNEATQSLVAVSRSQITWLRGGTAPEASAVTFEVSTDGGTTWMPLGAAFRISGGWDLASLNLPGSGLLRARARTHGGEHNGSAGLIEQTTPYTLPPP
jgi:hypothetical protein